MNVRKGKDTFGITRNPMAQVKVNILDTISSIQNAGKVTPQTLQPLFNLLRIIESELNKTKSTFDWKSCSFTEKIGNNDVNIANKIAFLLNHIHVEASVIHGLQKAKKITGYKHERANVEQRRSKEKKELYLISLKRLFKSRADYIRMLGLETENVIQILDQEYENESEQLSKLIREHCLTCNEEKITGVKSNKACFCHFYGNKVSYSRISGTLYVEVNKIINLLSTEVIDQLSKKKIGESDNLEKCDYHEKYGNPDMRKKRVIIQFDNKVQISSNWCVPKDLKFSRKIEVCKCREMMIEVWEQIGSKVRMVATTVMPLETIAKRISENENKDNTYTVFLEPSGLMNVVFCFTAEANQCVINQNKLLHERASHGLDGDKIIIPDAVEIKKRKDNHPLKRGKIFWAKMKRCRLARPDEADITVSLWVQWYKYNIDNLIVPLSIDQNDLQCTRDYSKCRKENTKWNFLRSIMVNVLGANSKSINITTRPEENQYKPFNSSFNPSFNGCTSFPSPIIYRTQPSTDLNNNIHKSKIDPSSILYDQNRSRTVYQFISTQTHNPINESINYPNKLHTPLSVATDNIRDDFQSKVQEIEHKPVQYQFITPIKSLPNPYLNTTPPKQIIPNIQKTPHTEFMSNTYQVISSTPYNKEHQHTRDKHETLSSNLTVEELDRDFDNYTDPNEENADSHVSIKQGQYEGQNIYFIQDVSVQPDYDENQRENQPPTSVSYQFGEEYKDSLLHNNDTKQSNTSRFCTVSPCRISNTNIDQFYCPDVTRENSDYMIAEHKSVEINDSEHKDNHLTGSNHTGLDVVYDFVCKESSVRLEQSSTQFELLEHNADDNQEVIEPTIQCQFVEPSETNPNESRDSDQCIKGFYSSIESQSVSHDHDAVIDDDDNDSGPSQMLDIVTNGDMFAELDLLSVLGMGHFGKVLLCQHQNSPNKVFAIKVMNKYRVSCEMESEALFSELNILKKISMQKHPFLVEFLGSFQNQSHLFLALEFASGGDLMGHIHANPFTEDVARFYGACVVLAFEFLHNSNIMYRDLKLDNVLMDHRGYVKLTDFGLSKENMCYESYTSTFCGTPEFLAPEIIDETSYNRGVDWWAFGVLMFEMLRGESPFQGKDDEDVMESIRMNCVNYDNMSAPAHSLVRRLLRSNPKDRLGNEHKNGVNNVKKHIFFSKIDWDGLLNLKMKAPMIPKLNCPGDIKYFEEDFTNLPINIQHEEDPPIPDDQSIGSIDNMYSPNANQSFDKVANGQGAQLFDQTIYASFDVPFDWSRLEYLYAQETDAIKRTINESDE